MSLKYSWVAVYSDGTVLEQFNDDGTENKYPAIDRSKLAHFLFVDRDTGIPHVAIYLRKGQQLICRRRTRLHFGSSVLLDNATGEIKARWEEAFWIAGWHENRNGVNVQCVIILFDDGRIEVLDKFRDDYAPYCWPKLEPYELLKEDSK